MISLDDFKKIRLEDKKIFDKYYEKYPPNHSDYVFTTIISWIDYGEYHFTELDGNLLLYSNIDGTIRLRPPIGKHNKKVFEQILKLARSLKSDYPIGMIDEKTKKWINKKYPSLNIIPHREYFEYVYKTKDLVELSGSKYAKIRNRLNKFEKTYDCSLEDINDENQKEIRNFLRRWCLWKDCESDHVLKHEKDAVVYSIEKFFELNLSGIALRIDGEIEAIAVYEKINPKTVVVHYEKASPDYDGIYKKINNETAKKINKQKIEYINRESDMGIPGLRKAKLSYRPDHMIKIYHISKGEI